MYGNSEFVLSFQEVLTEKQQAVVEEFERRMREGLPPPTHRELCEVFGWSAPGTARDCLNALVRKRVLVRSKGKARGIRLARPSARFGRISLLGDVVAGHPISAEQLSEEDVNVPASWVGPDTFALRVYGDSMRDAGILDGDIVVVRGTPSAKPGDIVAATIDGATTLKRLTRDRRGRFWLAPENPAYPAIEIDSPATTIHGVVVGLMRDYKAVLRGGTR